MSKIVKVSDLTKHEGDPTERADYQRTFEKVGLKGKMFGGAAVELRGKFFPGSPQSSANMTFVLVAAGCLLAGTATVIGVAGLTALIVGLCAPVGIFVLVHVISRRWGK